MPTSFTKLKLPDAILVCPHIYADERGYFMEIYNEEEFHDAGICSNFVQDNQSCSRYGVIRGLHYQQAPYTQGKLVRVLTGTILDVIVDARPESKTCGESLCIELEASRHEQLFVPRGFLHGFAVLSEQAIIAYKCDAPYHPSAELTVRYDDPTLNINWVIPQERRLLSPKDLNYSISFTQFIATIKSA